MIFVSYSRADAEFAFRLATDLRMNGLDVWLDQLSIAPGERWDSAIESALRASTSVVVIMSPAAATSHIVLDEIAYALDEKKRVIPVIYKGGDIPLRIRRLQRLDFTSAYSPALANLVKSLRSPDPAEPIAESHAHDVRPANDQNKRLRSKRDIRKAAIFAAMAQRRAGELGALSSHHASGGAARGLLLFGVGGALSGIISLLVVEQISGLNVFTVGFSVGCPGFSWAVIGSLCEMRRAPSIAAVVSSAVTLLVCCVVLGIADGLTLGLVLVVPLLALIVVLIMRLMVDYHDEVAKRQRREMRRHG